MKLINIREHRWYASESDVPPESKRATDDEAALLVKEHQIYMSNLDEIAAFDPQRADRAREWDRMYGPSDERTVCASVSLGVPAWMNSHGS